MFYQKVWNYQVVSIPSNLSSERTDEEVKEFCKKILFFKVLRTANI